MKAITHAAFAATVLLSAASAAHSATVIDQSQDFWSNFAAQFDYGGFTGLPLGQSFTAGMSRPLTGVTVFCNGVCSTTGSNTLTISIYSGAGTGGSLLGTATRTLVGVYDPSTNSQILRMDVASLRIMLAAGSQYSFAFIAVSGPGNVGRSGILASTGNPYHGGSIFTPFYSLTSGRDLKFRTDVAATVPEPASWALMIGGFGLVGGTLRRRRSAFA